MENKTIQIGDCEYTLMPAGFMASKKELAKLTSLLDGCFPSVEKVNFDIGRLIKNLSSETMEEIEKFICKYATVTDETGKKFLLQNSKEVEGFFSSHTGDYYSFIIEGFKFHFLGFLPSGLASKVNTLDLEKLADSLM